MVHGNLPHPCSHSAPWQGTEPCGMKGPGPMQSPQHGIELISCFKGSLLKLPRCPWSAAGSLRWDLALVTLAGASPSQSTSAPEGSLMTTAMLSLPTNLLWPQPRFLLPTHLPSQAPFDRGSKSQLHFPETTWVQFPVLALSGSQHFWVDLFSLCIGSTVGSSPSPSGPDVGPWVSDQLGEPQFPPGKAAVYFPETSLSFCPPPRPPTKDASQGTLARGTPANMVSKVDS